MIDVTAIDTQGQDVASVSLNVDVDNSLDASGRLATDFESGSIDTSTYVEFGLMSLYAFELLPERYAASFADPEAEGNGLIIEYLSLWDQLDQATQQRLGDAVEATMILDFGTAFGLWDPGAAATASASASSTALDLSAWPECFDTFSGDVACTHISDNFEIYYVPVGLAGSNVASGVSETDVLNRTGTVVTSCGATCNQVPDYVDRVAAALEQAWDTYGDLEFRLPSSPVRVSILNTRAHTFPNPIPFLQAGIALNNRNDQFSTARHEMFHMVQYEYADILDLARDGVLAWLEATAEWGAHQAAQPDDNLGIVNRDTPYYNRVGAFLSRPNWSALTYEDVIPLLNPFRNQQRQYGAFLLAEHLEESLAPPAADTTVIEATWQEIDAGHSAATALSNVIAANSPFGWSEQEQLVDFHIDALVLSNQGSVGFGDSDVALWKGQLASPPFGSGILALPNERVLSAEHDFGVSDLWDPGVTERPFVASGGSAYASMGLRDQGGVPLQGTLVIEAPALTDLAYTVVMFDGYPNLCPAYPDPFRIDTGVGTAGFVMIDLDGTCDEAVLVISHTDYELGFSGNLEPGTFGNGVQTDWMAEHLSCSEPLEYGVDILGDASFENHLGNVATGPDGEVFPGEIAAGAAPWPLAWADGSYTNDANHTDWAVFTNNGVQGSFPLPPARWSISTNAPRTGISHAQTTVGLNFGGSSHQLIPIGFPMCRDAGDFSPTLAGFNGVWTARVQPGDTIDWSVWAKVDTAASSPDVDMWFEIWTEDLTTSVYDDGTFYFNGELGQSYSEFTHTAVAPADSYYLIAYVQFSHPDFDTIIDVDDARLSLTPAGP